MPLLTTSTRSLARAVTTRPLRTPRLPPTPRPRLFHTSPSPRSPQKDAQDKDTLSPTSTEYSQTGRGDAAAAHEDAAFNPQKTSPENELSSAEGEKGKENPLEVSPANKGASEGLDEQAGGAAGSKAENSTGGKEEREGRSGAGRGPKNG